MAIRGDLREISLPTLVQMLCIERRSASLELSRRGEEGGMFLADGEIVHACLGQLEGEDAAYSLLAWTEGLFAIYEDASPRPRTIGKSLSHLLIESSRRIDERRRDEEGGERSLARPLSRAEEEVDRDCEESLFSLVSELEQVKARLLEPPVRRRPVRGLWLLEDMLNRVAEHAESVPGAVPASGSMVERLAGAAARFPQVRLIYVQNNRVSMKTAANLFTSWGDDPADRVHYFRQLCRGAVAVLEDQLGRFAAYLLSPTRRDLWRETYTVFLLDLGHQMEQLPL